MNLTATVAVIVLVTINSVLGILLLLGKVKLVIVRPQVPQGEPASDPIAEVIAPKTKPSRRRKARVRHLYLHVGVSAKQLAEATDFFKQYRDETGEKVTLHVPSPDGPERSIEIPHPVRWSPAVKEGLRSILGGWS